MKRCKKCKVPLEGVLSKVSRALFKVAPSVEDPDICNRCATKVSKKYKCHICERDIDESVAISHVKAEEYLINLIKKDHPQWQKDNDICQECLEYYRKLVKDTEI
jgi:ribosomal protein L34E